ncbi:MAG: putative TIM-barrel fold metal-dependent hydrolase [Limisphaerales bacterium]|jgi:predicted TIM-barrel fold metal-dependent hydrolase
MAYAPLDRPFYDADSHIMELPDFITSYADPSIRDEIPEVSYSASIVSDDEVKVIMDQGGRHSDEHIAAQLAFGDDLIAESKEIQALGAFTSADRTQAMDLLGFKKQLVFATHSVVAPFHPSSKKTTQWRYGAARGHNRHMAEFCATDNRLMGVAAIPLDDAEHAIAEAEWCIDNGLEAIWVPHRAPIGMAPGHVDLEGFWARLAEAGVPFVIHVGGAPLQVHKSWGNNGRAATRDWLGGGENVRTKDAAILHQAPETFISMMLLDGVFARHPGLRGAAVELGAGWVPEMLNRLDETCRIFGRADESVRFDRKPSEQLTEQMGFTPMHNENIARIIEQSNEDLYLFSSDYPHIEGTKDPIGKFERHIGDASEDLKTKFYSENFLRLWPEARV